MTENNTTKSAGVLMREFFGVSVKDLMEFKKADPEGYAQVSKGIADGTMTY